MDDLSDDETYAASDCDISDEECDIYIRDPEEVEATSRPAAPAAAPAAAEATPADVEEELALDFPTLSAAATVPYEGSDDEAEVASIGGPSSPPAPETQEEEEQRKKEEALAPLPKTKDGRLYNSFKSYKNLVTSSGVTIPEIKKTPLPSPSPKQPSSSPAAAGGSRIIGGAVSHTSQSTQVEDDGEGWVGEDNLDSLDAAFDLTSPPPPPTAEGNRKKEEEGSGSATLPTSLRCACATTDFAMQNVLLQMNLPLLSLSGTSITSTKSWVTRCGACFAVYGGENGGARLFCERCGSDALQRVAASTDSNTGKVSGRIETLSLRQDEGITQW